MVVARLMLYHYVERIANEKRVQGLSPKEAKLIKEAIRRTEPTEEEREWLEKAADIWLKKKLERGHHGWCFMRFSAPTTLTCTHTLAGKRRRP